MMLPLAETTHPQACHMGHPSPVLLFLLLCFVWAAQTLINRKPETSEDLSALIEIGASI